MEKRKSFVIYDSFLDMVEMIPDKEDQLKLILAVLRYGLGREDMELENPYLNAMFTGIKANIDAAQNRYDKACSGGVKGGRPTSISQDEVQELKSVGKTQKQVAQMLGVSERTVKRYWNVVSDDEGCQKVTKGETCRHHRRSREHRKIDRTAPTLRSTLPGQSAESPKLLFPRPVT